MLARYAILPLLLSFFVDHAQAGVVVFDNCDAFDMFSDALGVRNESLDFTAYEGASLDVACSLGTVGLRSSSGIQGVLGSYMKADSIGETLVIDFEEEVRSVGGFFFLVDEF